MTLQQLKYIEAIDRYRSFAEAAVSLEVTQPTLSGMVGKLEEELGVKLFERTSRKVSTTTTGAAIVKQARLVLMEANRIKEMVDEIKGDVTGELRLSVGPSIAPYLLPDFIRIYMSDYPQVMLHVEEMRPEAMTRSLIDGTLDAGIATSGLSQAGYSRFRFIRSGFSYICRKDAAANCWYSIRKSLNTNICGS